jgi:hypothetical protein
VYVLVGSRQIQGKDEKGRTKQDVRIVFGESGVKHGSPVILLVEDFVSEHDGNASIVLDDPALQATYPPESHVCNHIVSISCRLQA